MSYDIVTKIVVGMPVVSTLTGRAGVVTEIDPPGWTAPAIMVKWSDGHTHIALPNNLAVRI